MRQMQLPTELILVDSSGLQRHAFCTSVGAGGNHHRADGAGDGLRGNV